MKQLTREEKDMLKDEDNIGKKLEQLKQVLKGQETNLDKYHILESMADENKLDFFTQFMDFDDILRMNKIQMWIKLAPVVFGDTENNRAVLGVFGYHVKQHKQNMTSLNRARETAIVKALAGDTTTREEVSGVKKFVGARQ